MCDGISDCSDALEGRGIDYVNMCTTWFSTLPPIETVLILSTHTMSLQSSLLADLDDLSDGEPQEEQNGGPSNGPGTAGAMLPPSLPSGSLKRPAEDDEDDIVVKQEEEDEEGDIPMGYVPEGGVRPAEELDAEQVEQSDLTDIKDVSKVAKLMTGTKLKEVLAVGHTIHISSASDLPVLTTGNREILRSTQRHVVNRWTSRRKPRIPPRRHGQQHVGRGRQRDHAGAQVHQRSLRSSIPRAGTTHSRPLDVHRRGTRHRQCRRLD